MYQLGNKVLEATSPGSLKRAIPSVRSDELQNQIGGSGGIAEGDSVKFRPN